MALPPNMFPPEGPASPASTPTENPGAMADGMSKVTEAINLLEMALPTMPPGSEPHKAVLEAVTKLSKAVPPSSAVPGVQMTQLTGLQKKAQDNAALMQLTQALGAGPAVPPVGGGGADMAQGI